MSLKTLTLEDITQIAPLQLLELLSRDGFIIFVRGGKENGKTNTAMLLMQICHELGLRKHFATNIKTQSYYIKQIANKPDLDHWLNREKGLKLYCMDELGKNLRKFGFASKKNQALFDILQLIRHYDCGFVGMAPAGKFVDTSFLIPGEVLDMEIQKINKTTAKVIDYYHKETYFWRDIPATSINHNGKDICEFSMEKEEDLTDAPLCCKVAARAAKFDVAKASMATIGAPFNLSSEETKRELLKHLKHQNHASHILVEDDTPLES